jgi:hypothetical protein
MAKDALLRLQTTTLFQELLKREASSGVVLSERVKDVVAHVAPLMERIPDHMPEFTLHDPNHGAKVVELMGRIIPADTLAQLNAIELSILIYAGYLHDLGMTCSRDQAEKIIRTAPDFARIRAASSDIQADIEKLKAASDHRGATHLEDRLLNEYLRCHHVQRSASFIRNDLQGKLAIEYSGIPYGKWVQAVCDSHALPVARLRDETVWPRNALIGPERVNVQYLSLVLRLGDILDLDPERTPKVLLDFINPKDATSIREWHKHRSVIGWEIKPNLIEFEAECTHPVYERALREFLAAIEEERKDTMLLLDRYQDELSKKYRLELRQPVTAERIRSDGSYIYSELNFQIDHKRVLQLLSGERIYGKPELALRELLQNAFDAVRCRKALEERAGSPFTPRVSVKLQSDRLIIEDNGIGMDDHALRNYFMQVGRSYYTSAEFRAEELEVDIASEFGIGILSVFMVADSFQVESRRLPQNALEPPRPIKVEVPHAYGYFVQRPTNRQAVGTVVTLFLKPGHPFSQENLHELVLKLVPFSEISVCVECEGKTKSVKFFSPGDWIDSRVRPSKNYPRVAIPLNSPGFPSGVVGSVYIAPRRWGGPQGTIAQRGFAINPVGPEDRMPRESSILSGWVNVIPSIDFRHPSRLKLSPDRNQIIPNETVSTVREAIERLSSAALKEHLGKIRAKTTDEEYAKYCDMILEDGVVDAEIGGIEDVLHPEAKEFFLDYIWMKSIARSGELAFVPSREVLADDEIGILSTDAIPEGLSLQQIRQEIDDSSKLCIPILLTDWPGRYNRSRFVKSAVGRTNGYLVTNASGLVVDLIDRRANARPNFHLQGLMEFSWGIISTNRPPPAVIYPSDQSDFDHPVYNAHHPLFAALLKGNRAKNKTSEHGLLSFNTRFTGLLSSAFRSGLATDAHMWMAVPDYTPGRRTTTVNLLLRGALRRMPRLRNEIAQLWKDFAGEAEEYKVVKSEKDLPESKDSDLPWFWF